MGAASTFRCVECGALFAEHFSVCSSCWRSGSLIPVAHRLRAAIDYQPGVSNARALAGMSWRKVEHAGAYEELVVGSRALVLVSGPPGSGKSSLSARFANAVRGPVLYVAAEEGISPSLAARLLRCNVKRPDFHVLTRASADAAVAFAQKHKAVACVVDSVQEAAVWTSHELRHVLEVVPSLDVLLAVMQVTKAGLAAGSNAYQHECDVHMRVETMAWNVVKSRYQDLNHRARFSSIHADEGDDDCRGA
jgi:predicted ATP-dependent serine protease